MSTPTGPAKPQHALMQGALVRVQQIKQERRGTEHPAPVVHVDGSHGVVAAVWTHEVDREHFSFQPGVQL